MISSLIGNSYMAYVSTSIVGFAVLGYLSHKFYFAGGKCKSKKRLDGKVAIVTGANCGIGYETALDLAKRGAHVIVACRDLVKAQKAVDQIISESNNNKVEVEKLDLASQQSIRDFAQRMNKRLDRLDLLINNAGLSVRKRTETAEGIETTFGVNHLGPFLLTNLLLDKLKASAPSRIVNLSSYGHYMISDMNWDDLEYTKNFDGLEAYKQSKLANVLFTKSLAKRLEGTNVTTYSLHPGGVRTEIFRHSMENLAVRIAVYIFLPLLYVVLKSCKEGAQTTLTCALDDDVVKYNGCYFSDCKFVECSKAGNNSESAERLWKISEKMCGLKSSD